MAKTESTAVNALIDIQRTARPFVDPRDDLMFTPPARVPESTQRLPQAQLERQAQQIKQAVLPPPQRALPAPQLLTLTRKPLPPASGTRTDTPLPAPLPASSVTGEAPWLESTGLADALEPGYTEQVKRQRTATFKLVRRLALPLVGFVGLGAAVGTYIALNSRDKAKIAPTEVVVAPEPTPAPAPTPAPTPMVLTAPIEGAAKQVDAPVPVAAAKLIDVRIDSRPLGATVMIVDRGKTAFLGKTPIATSLDSAHGYDLVFSIGGRPTQMAHLDPTQQQKIDVELPAAQAHREVAPVVVPAVAPVHRDEPKPVVAREPAPVAAETGNGTLMVSAKPPCQIVIDGNPTGLITPQRAIALPAGHHSVALVSAEDPSLTRTVSVEISANKATKLITDLMK